MDIGHAIVLSLLLSGATTQVTVTLDWLEGFVVEGSNITLTCTSSVSTLFHMEFIVDSTEDSTTKQIYFHNYLSGQGGPSNGYLGRTYAIVQSADTITLVILQNELPHDDGSYYCSVEPYTPPVVDSTKIFIDVSVPVERHMLRGNLNRYSGIYEVTCATGPGRPSPTLDWTENGTLVQTNDTREIHCSYDNYCTVNVTLDANSPGTVVKCIATQGHPFNWTSVEIYNISDYSIKTEETELTNDDCTEIKLEYEHSINTFSSLWWEKDGDTLTEFDVSTGKCKPPIGGIICDATEKGHMITIKDTRKKDTGSYSCVAQVDIGVTSSEPIEVIIHEQWSWWKCLVANLIILLVIVLCTLCFTMRNIWLAQSVKWRLYIFIAIMIVIVISVYVAAIVYMCVDKCADWVCPVITTLIQVAACVIIGFLLYKFNPTIPKSTDHPASQDAPSSTHTLEIAGGNPLYDQEK